jgi:hypothetical protein
MVLDPFYYRKGPIRYIDLYNISKNSSTQKGQSSITLYTCFIIAQLLYNRSSYYKTSLPLSSFLNTFLFQSKQVIINSDTIELLT